MSLADVMGRVEAIQARIAEVVPSSAQSVAGGAFTAALQQARETQRGLMLPEDAVAATSAAPTATGEATPYDDMIVQAARANGVDPALLKGLIRAESNFNPQAVSHAGAQGLGQLMPGTAAGLGVTDPFDPKQNIDAAAKYLGNALRIFNGDEQLALASYNAGTGAVRKYGNQIPPYPETQAYVPKVLGYANDYRAQGFGSAAAVTATPGAFALASQTAVEGAAPSGRAQAALAAATRQLGTPYRWGGESPATGFDCSGLAQWAYAQQGVTLPRVAEDQFRAGAAVERSDLRPGDLVFFRNAAGSVHHEGIYVGSGKFLHAPHTGDVVKISSLSEPYYAREFAGARRVA